tara:strand:- start:127 stop:426 length:300 start_codon:yes stop_codon:yes gene_type:complete
MAFATVNLEKSGLTKQAPVGFSWTTLFFGALPALFRGDFKWTFIMLFAGVFTAGIAWLVFPFIYNRLYITSMIEGGYKIKNYTGNKAQIEAKLSIKLKK